MRKYRIIALTLCSKHSVHKHQESFGLVDITYARPLSGFAYTVFVVDVYSRKIVGVATRCGDAYRCAANAGLGTCINDCRANPWKPAD